MRVLQTILEIWGYGALANIFIFPLILVPTIIWEVIDSLARRLTTPGKAQQTALEVFTYTFSGTLITYITFIAASWLTTFWVIGELVTLLYNLTTKKISPAERVVFLYKELLKTIKTSKKGAQI